MRATEKESALDDRKTHICIEREGEREIERKRKIKIEIERDLPLKRL